MCGVCGALFTPHIYLYDFTSKVYPLYLKKRSETVASELYVPMKLSWVHLSLRINETGLLVEMFLANW